MRLNQPYSTFYRGQLKNKTKKLRYPTNLRPTNQPALLPLGTLLTFTQRL